VQSRALTLIRRQPPHAGLTRTAACRVGSSIIYVLVGLNAATTHYAVLQVAFAAFVITQLTWQINAWLDVRLNRPPRSRKRWRIQITLTRTPVRPKPRP
jgi:hypothetical protein